MDTVTCMVCGAVSKRITHKHLAKHNLTIAQYREMYPSAQMISSSVRSALRTNTLEHFVSKFGDEGHQKYEQYKQFQAEKNTFEYKASKHGWSREQFDQYNLSRANTLENAIIRHGQEAGAQKWTKYVEHQRKAGVTLEWFTEKHGLEHGTELYEQICKSKRHNLDLYVQRYGPLIGKQRYMDWINKKCAMLLQYTSAAERSFVAEVKARISQRCYDVTTDQFKIWDPITKRIFCYDVVFPDLKLVIEYNGDYWHCNPTRYAHDYLHPTIGRLASTIWDQDAKKLAALTARGFEYIVVWESDWKRDKANILEQIQEHVKRKLRNSNEH